MSQPDPGYVAAATRGVADQPQQPAPPPASLPPEFYPVLVGYLKPGRRKEPTRKLLVALMATCRGLRDAVTDTITACAAVLMPIPQDTAQLQQRALQLHAVTNLFKSVHLLIAPHQTSMPRNYMGEAAWGGFQVPPADQGWLPRLLGLAASTVDTGTLASINMVTLQRLALPSLVPSWLPTLCPSVTHLVLHKCTLATPADPLPPTQHPTISHLTCDMHLPLPAQQLQSQLTALPQLTHLTYRLGSRAFASPAICLPTVQQLRLFTPDLASIMWQSMSELSLKDPLAHMAQQFPGLQHLIVDLLDDATLGRLLASPLPRLKHVQCRRTHLNRSYREVTLPFALSVFTLDYEGLGHLPLDAADRIRFAPLQALAVTTDVPPDASRGQPSPDKVLDIIVTPEPQVVARVQPVVQRWAAAGRFLGMQHCEISPAMVDGGPAFLQAQTAALVDAVAVLEWCPGMASVSISNHTITAAVVPGLCAALAACKARKLSLPGCECRPRGALAALVAGLPESVTTLWVWWRHGAAKAAEQQVEQMLRAANHPLCVELSFVPPQQQGRVQALCQQLADEEHTLVTLKLLGME